MRMTFFITCFWFALVTIPACDKPAPDPPPSGSTLYFPPAGNVWETTDPASLGWNMAAFPDLEQYLRTNNTRAFLVLQNGRIVIERYYNTTPTGAPFTAESLWYWASAGKTLTAMLVGIAQREGRLKINDASSRYLGTGWTSLPVAEENRITVFHQLTMTTGLDDGVADPFCTQPACLKAKAPAGTRWAYHNGPYTLLDKVISNATGQDFQAYFNQKLRDPIGMTGQWIKVDFNNVYYSTGRSMARYGLLLLAKGIWNGRTILDDAAYVAAISQTSQPLNPSYGYLTWLNGKGRIMFPGSQILFPRDLCPPAPDDMYAAMGKNGQLINVVPSKGLVLIRMGDSPDNSLIPLQFQEEMWTKLNLVIR